METEPKKLFKYYLDQNIQTRDNRPLFFRRTMRYDQLEHWSHIDGEWIQENTDTPCQRRVTWEATSNTESLLTSHGTTLS